MIKNVFALCFVSIVFSGCNSSDSKTPSKADPKTSPQVLDPKAGQPSSPSAQHLYEPKPDSILISSCSLRWKSTPPADTSGSDQSGAEILKKLVEQGKMRMCFDLHISGTLTDSSKAMHIDDRNAACNSSAEKVGSVDIKNFSLTSACPAPATGLQSMTLDSGSNNGSSYTTQYRQTFYFDNLTAEERSSVAKYVLPFLQKNTSNQGSALSPTSDLK